MGTGLRRASPARPAALVAALGTLATLGALAALGAVSLAPAAQATPRDHHPGVAAPGPPSAGVAAPGPPSAGVAVASPSPTASPPSGPGASGTGRPASAGDPSAGSEGLGDPLSRNGFQSALCRDVRLARSLTPTLQQNCRTSGFAAAAAPVDHYGFDVHIDSGLDLATDALLLLQQLILTPVWTALLWLVHAVIVALEWCYSIDLLDPSAMGQVAGALRSAQATFTQPWLVTMLAIAAVLAAYQGIVRRRIADTLGDVALMLAMITAGLWVIANPSGTVGELYRIANDASLGTLGALSAGTPEHAERTFGGGLEELFSSAIESPWCFMEFGDVDWCQNPARFDRGLRAAGAQLADIEHATATCTQPASHQIVRCAPSGSALAFDSARTAELLSAARTNGQVFLALPANGPSRNSIHQSLSLLRTLCGAQDATRCPAPTAAQAEFRTAPGTWPRAGGLLLIAIGCVGMLALLAFIALRLLGAAIGVLFYLLLAPLAVLAPAVGDGGRSAFRSWALRLLGALVAKLLYSAFLGVVLLMLHLLAGFGTLGWWTQWLLIAVFWWGVFQHRHRVFEYAALGHRETASRGMHGVRGLLTAARHHGRLPGMPRLPLPPDLPETGAREPQPPKSPGAWTREPKPPKSPEAGTPGPGPGPEPAPACDPSARDHSERSLTPAEMAARLAAVHAEHRARVTRDGASLPEEQADTGAVGARIERIATARRAADEAGDRRRAARLARRASALEPAAIRRPGARPSTAAPGGGIESWAPEAIDLYLDRQAALPRGIRQDLRRDAAGYRDYPTLAPLAGRSASAYHDLDAGKQRAARLEIDRELERRLAPASLAGAKASASMSPAPSPPQSMPGALAAGSRRESGVRRGESEVLRRERQFALEGGLHIPELEPPRRRSPDARRTSPEGRR